LHYCHVKKNAKKPGTPGTSKSPFNLVIAAPNSGNRIRALQPGQLDNRVTVRNGAQSYVITIQPLSSGNRERMSATPLTERELDVLELLAKGDSADDISHRLHISPDTVRTHRHNLRRKLGIKERSVRSLIKYQQWWENFTKGSNR